MTLEFLVVFRPAYVGSCRRCDRFNEYLSSPTYYIFSTGHKVKNESSNISQAVRKLKFLSVLLLTGTPLQV